jgi:glycerophosphoryl diester phosphodiesterase
MLCFGHRGARGHSPENTLDSIEKAISLGVDWIEIDVHPVERELVVIHDMRLERTTTGTGYVAEKSLDYLRSLDAGEGQRIPLLGEVFDRVDRRVGINVEIRSPGSVASVISLIDSYVKNDKWSYDAFLVSSFIHPEIDQIKKVQPKIKTGALVSGIPLDYPRFAIDLDAYSIHPKLDYVSPKIIDSAHEHGLKVFVYTVNHPDDIERMRDMGADGLFTDYPERVKG